MKLGSLVGHGCWAAVAVAAFVLGSKRENEGSSGAQAASDAPRTSIRGASGGANLGSGAGGGGISRSRRGGSTSASGEASSEAGYRGGAATEAELAALASEAFRDGSPLNRRRAFARLLESLTAENAQSLVKHLKEHKVGGEQWRDFHYAWGTIDGEAAVKHAMKSDDYDIAHTMSGWASAYPEDARRFLESLPADAKVDRNQMQRALVSGMADTDTGRATDYVFQLAGQGNGEASGLLGIVSSEVLRNFGTQEGVRWSESLPDGKLKASAMDTVANRFTNEDPVAAAQWVERYATEDYAARVIEEVGDEWAERDPVAAISWLDSLPDSEGRTMGIGSAYGEWGRRDPVAAGERITAMPRGEQRDAAISGYSRSLAYRDPGAAIDWANSIAQDSVRNRALTRAGQELFRRDAEAARAWVASSGLPAEAQEAVLNPPRRRR